MILSLPSNANKSKASLYWANDFDDFDDGDDDNYEDNNIEIT